MRKIGIIIAIIIVVAIVVWAWLINAGSPVVDQSFPGGNKIRGIAPNSLCWVRFKNGVADYNFELDNSEVSPPGTKILNPDLDPVFRFSPQKKTLFISFTKDFYLNAWHKLNFVARKDNNPDISFTLEFQTSSKNVPFKVMRSSPPRRLEAPLEISFSDLLAGTDELIYNLNPSLASKVELEGDALLISAQEGFAPETEYALTLNNVKSIKGQTLFTAEPYSFTFKTGAK